MLLKYSVWEVHCCYTSKHNDYLKLKHFATVLSCELSSFFLTYLCAQSCLPLCDPLDCSPPSFSVHGISQARILEWIAISFSRGSSRPRGQSPISCVSCIADDSLPAEPSGKPLLLLERTTPTNYSIHTVVFCRHFLENNLPFDSICYQL